MTKLLMLSVLAMNIAIPARAALAADPRRALPRALLHCAVFNFFYVLSLVYVVPRLL
jgi:hypothetical protein